MNAKEFREFGYAAVDFIADYMENVHERLIHLFCVRVCMWIKREDFF